MEWLDSRQNLTEGRETPKVFDEGKKEQDVLGVDVCRLDKGDRAWQRETWIEENARRGGRWWRVRPLQALCMSTRWYEAISHVGLGRKLRHAMGPSSTISKERVDHDVRWLTT